MSGHPSILIERTGGRWCVRVFPDPGDGSLCSASYPEYEAATLFASRLRRARGWPIVNPADDRQARQAQRR